LSIRLKNIRQALSRQFSKLHDKLYGQQEYGVLQSIKQADDQRWPSWRQIKMLRRVLTPHEKYIAFGLLVLCLTSGLILSWRVYAEHTLLVPADGGNYTEGLVGNPRTINPLLASSEAELNLSRLVNRGLFKYTEQGELTTDLAQEWNLSDDKTTYRIKLKPDLKWSDGQNLTADDAYFTFLSAQDKTLNSPQSGSFKNVDISLSDDGWLVFKLKEPYQPFLASLTVGLIPIHLWQNINPERWLLAEANLKPVGTGPWRFKSLSKDKQGNLIAYTLEPNPYTHTAKPHLNQIEVKFYSSLNDASDALKQGAIDGLGGLNLNNENFSARKYNTLDLILPQYTAILFNPQQNSSLKDKRVRQALNYATNRLPIIQQALKGQARPANGPFTFGEAKLLTAGQNINFDQSKAQSLLKQAGLKQNKEGQYLGTDGQPLTINLTIVDQDDQLQVAELIKQQWKNLGVTVNIEPVPLWRLQMDVIEPRDYQALLASELTGLDMDLYPFWHSSQIAAPGLNLSLFQNRDADQLLSDARRTFNQTERLNKYVKFQQILTDESPAVFLYSQNYRYVVTKNLNGLNLNMISQPADRFYGSENWYIKTKRQ